MVSDCSSIELQNQYASLQGLTGENIYNVAAHTGSHEEKEESEQISPHLGAPTLEKWMKSLIINNSDSTFSTINCHRLNSVLYSI